jgi:hypothetical protein
MHVKLFSVSTPVLRSLFLPRACMIRKTARCLVHYMLFELETLHRLTNCRSSSFRYPGLDLFNLTQYDERRAGEWMSKQW